MKPQGLMKLKAYKPSSKHKKKRAANEIEKGGRIGRDGKLVSIERVIDRDSNRYKETIKAENGQTMVNKDEKLSEHRMKTSTYPSNSSLVVGSSPLIRSSILVALSKALPRALNRASAL